ncbi:MAG: glycerophosphoryl diester phosphodiesterase [Gammaproteobacteria bacterium]|nr:glycerophosphoryl diester phosphodiesterase [Gammaproteobacteria bacterium]
MWQPFKKIAHRGASTIAPENTLIALQKAVEKGATSVEFDVMLTRDGVPVIMHDWSVNRTTDGDGRVCDLDYAEIATLDAGSWFGSEFKDTRVPTLAEWLQCASQLKCPLNIELKAKSSYATQLAGCVHWHLQKYWHKDLPPPLISSVNEKCLMAMQHIDPKALLGVVCRYWPLRPVYLLRRLHAVSLHVNYKRLTQARIQKIHDAGFKVLAFTVNDPADQERLFSWGVDGVFSDLINS